MTKKVKRVTAHLASMEATPETGRRVLRTAFEALVGVIAGGIADVFVQDFGSPAFRIAMFSLITLAVSTAVTAALNETDKVTRSTKTFVQVFLGVVAGGIATVLQDYGTPAFRAGLFGLLTVAISSALAAAMNLERKEV